MKTKITFQVVEDTLVSYHYSEICTVWQGLGVKHEFIMKINKQLFEDVLSGKLKGTFVLRCGTKISSDELSFNDDYDKEKYPYKLWKFSYTPEGYFHISDPTGGLSIIDFIPVAFAIDPEMYSYNQKDIEFIEHFINDYHMKENELTIEIPEGKIVDWEESKRQNKIVLKDKQLTYENICEKLFKHRDIFYIKSDGGIENASYSDIESCICDETNATTEHQLKCILAKNKLANVAKYLNDGWQPSRTTLGHFDAWVIYVTPDKNYIGCVKIVNCANNSNVLFKTSELADQAIEILGEETIKLALEPLGI